MNERKTVLALGFFDGIHIGHAALLETAKRRAAECGAEPAVLTFDRHPDTYVKGVQVELLNSTADRRYIAKRFFDIDNVYYIHFNTEVMRMPWREFLEDITAAYGTVHFVVGHDFSFGYRGEGTAETLRGWCAERGLGCDVIAPVVKDGIIVSSTYIRTLVEQGDMERANAFLGHPHLLTDTVRTGFRIGRTMDYPTINMRFADGVLVPKWGVYAAKAVFEGGSFIAATNIGVRPTFDGQSITVETHIIDFSADLYGKTVCVELHSFLRPERKFESQEALQAQIRQDAARTKQYFGI